MRWPGKRPPVSVLPLANPIRTSLTSGEGGVRVPLYMRMPFVGARGDAACVCGLGRVQSGVV